MVRRSGALSVSFLFLILLVFALSGCNSSKTPSVDQITQGIKQSVDLSKMRVGDSAALKKLYDINSEELDGFSLLTAPSNIKADEIAIFKVKNENDIEGIKDKITKRIDKQSKSFNGYLPDEYYLIQHNVLKAKGNYIIFIISKDADKISKAFDDSFK